MAEQPVNPPPQLKLPPLFANDPAVRAYYRSFDRFMLQLWKRSGGGTDLIETAITEVNSSLESELFGYISQIEQGLSSLSDDDNNGILSKIEMLGQDIRAIQESFGESLPGQLNSIEQDLKAIKSNFDVVDYSTKHEQDIDELIQSKDVFPPAITEFNCITKNQNYTAVSHDFINAKSGATITLPEYPAKNSVIIVRNGDGSRIKLDGNSRNINGCLNGLIGNEGTAIEMHYFIDTNEWFAK